MAELTLFDGDTKLIYDKVSGTVHRETNADRIRAMSDEELAEKWWKLLDCGVCPARPNCSLHHEDCIQFTLEWLKKEVDG